MVIPPEDMAKLLARTRELVSHLRSFCLESLLMTELLIRGQYEGNVTLYGTPQKHLQKVWNSEVNLHTVRKKIVIVRRGIHSACINVVILRIREVRRILTP